MTPSSYSGTWEEKGEEAMTAELRDMELLQKRNKSFQL